MPTADHSERLLALNIVIAMFSVPVCALWFLVFAGTLISELVPLSLDFEAQFPTVIFYAYQTAKLAAFFLLAFLTPLAWWHYKSLGLGALFAFCTTALVEVGQAFVPGHRASVLELAVKMAVLFAGFATGLDVRKFQRFAVGPLSVYFSSRYW